MARTLRWRGSKAIHLQPGYPKFFSRADSEGYRLVYSGPYKTLMAQKPVRGQQLQGYPGYFLDELLIEPEGAGKDGPGLMSVTVSRIAPEPPVGGGSVDETEVEIDAGGLDKSIYACPAFADIDKETIAAIKKAVEANETIPGPTLPGPLEEEVQALADLLLKGQETFFVGSPQVRIVTTSHRKPTVGKVGRGTRTTDKPDPSAPDGYEWLKMADKATRTGRKGKWQRIQVWAGADEWAAIVYDEPAAS